MGLKLFPLCSSTLTQAPVKLIFKLLIVSKRSHVDVRIKITITEGSRRRMVGQLKKIKLFQRSVHEHFKSQNKFDTRMVLILKTKLEFSKAGSGLNFEHLEMPPLR